MIENPCEAPGRAPGRAQGEGSPGIAGVIHCHCPLGGSQCSSRDAHRGAQGSEEAEEPPLGELGLDRGRNSHPGAPGQSIQGPGPHRVAEATEG